jgi:NarL family two-component system sensor histidine kinase YdfH
MEMKSKTPSNQIEKDTIWFMWILTFVVVGIYITTLLSNPTILKPMRLVPFTILMIIHLVLHWRLGKITKNPVWIPRYVIVQGVIAFTVILISESIVLPIALFMGLIGEVIGLLGITRWGILAVVYYVVLGVVNVSLIEDITSMWGWLIGLLPMLIFVVIYVTLYQRQMDAREKAQDLAEQLEAANQQLSEYAARVEDLTLLAERQRMARELHDTLSQGLVGLILQLEAVDAHLSQHQVEKAREIVGLSMERARLTLSEARYTIGDLRGEKRVDLSLAEALKEELDRFKKTSGVDFQFEHCVSDGLPQKTTETLVRITTEALSNILRYANAKLVRVNLSKIDEKITLIIQDDGIGFNPQQVKEGHYGIIGMRERAKLAGGTFKLKSQAGQGTTIEVVLPIEKAHETN